MKTIFEAIKQSDNTALSELIKSKVHLNQTYDLNDEEIALMKSKTDDNFIIDLSMTQGLTPLFISVLYKNSDAFELLVKNGANLRHKTSGGLSLMFFIVIYGETKCLDIVANSAPDLLMQNMSIPLNPNGRFFFSRKSSESDTKSTASTSSATKQKTKYSNFDNLETYIDCCQKGDLEGLNRCLNQDTHKKDDKGSGLYYALAFGHEQCVRELVSFDVPIKNKHYFAAGLQPNNCVKNNASALYYVLKERVQQSSKKNPRSYPEWILKGNLEEVISQFECSSIDQQTSADYLYKLLTLKHWQCVRYVLSQDMVLEPRHFFAAGNSTDEKTAIKIFKLLAVYKIEVENLQAQTPHELLGVSEHAPDFVIKTAFKRLALSYHTDKRDVSVTAMQKILDAREKMLKDNSREGSREVELNNLFTQEENQMFASISIKSTGPK